MTLPPGTGQPPPPQAGGRRGRKPAPISEAAGLSHRAWLEPVRDFVFSSGLTLDDLVDRSGYSKTRISELLRGNGYYPAWEITFSVIRALGLPVQPMRRLWSAAAREAHKEPDWIRHCIRQVACEPETPPLAHRAFTETVRAPYTAYARTFLLTDDRVRWAVGETFDLLWLSWSTAVSSENLRRNAWRLLRSRVMARAGHREGRPDLRAAVFSTEEASGSVPDRLVVLTDLVDLFDAIARLPHDHMDVVVLRHLCGLDLEETIPYVTGLSPAIAHAVDHHARAALEDLLRPCSPRE
ncbi:XRE family transcriptional regulator [Streptomyces sp. TG1A-8]|uniref:XRE family transcriptional regulator n=1 Tax=Streptomyces sp. TG1A-8 TaxID=3051385 RepID=UPI00265B73DA|nr:XRE family transcriptional regulator [Streptomyces sp. TG1A-8]MDO0925692.1 XRE family transcriptional regulator [Streptomyces sp. TG1A-8]